MALIAVIAARVAAVYWQDGEKADVLMASRLTGRFEGYGRLRPEKSQRDAALLELVRSLGVTCSVCHVLSHIPEQGETLFTLLCDEELVLLIEVPHGKAPFEAVSAAGVPIAEYHDRIGQGKHRIRLDQTVKKRASFVGQVD